MLALNLDHAWHMMIEQERIVVDVERFGVVQMTPGVALEIANRLTELAAEAVGRQAVLQDIAERRIRVAAQFDWRSMTPAELVTSDSVII